MSIEINKESKIPCIGYIQGDELLLNVYNGIECPLFSLREVMVYFDFVKNIDGKWDSSMVAKTIPDEFKVKAKLPIVDIQFLEGKILKRISNINNRKSINKETHKSQWCVDVNGLLLLIKSIQSIELQQRLLLGMLSKEGWITPFDDRIYSHEEHIAIIEQRDILEHACFPQLDKAIEKKHAELRGNNYAYIESEKRLAETGVFELEYHEFLNYIVSNSNHVMKYGGEFKWEGKVNEYESKVIIALFGTFNDSLLIDFTLSKTQIKIAFHNRNYEKVPIVIKKVYDRIKEYGDFDTKEERCLFSRLLRYYYLCEFDKVAGTHFILGNKKYYFLIAYNSFSLLIGDISGKVYDIDCKRDFDIIYKEVVDIYKNNS
jgi:hypothetical protein